MGEIYKFPRSYLHTYTFYFEENILTTNISEVYFEKC